MILSVQHVTTYQYDEPMRSACQSLRLTPSRYQGQRVISWTLDVVGGTKGGSFRDGAGDRIEGWSMRGPVDKVVIRAFGQVETTDCAGVLRNHRELVHPFAYLRETSATWQDEAIERLAAEACDDSGTALARAHKLSAAVSEAIEYTPGATDAQTTAADALALGRGVCQDHAHALIAASRVRNIPARYVTGYLHSTADGEGHEASHAWAEVWVDDLGWVGFDPANECCPDERYIRIGSGLDAHDAAPIRGVSQGEGDESMNVVVALESVQQ
ncbi:transglutaminase [Thioclava sp. SK-1]|uniref:transglutaminase family protein n=1 Tax=Thioclava sp. SK-1 TaxID=1889770 RepID=UPI000824CB7A|nr:transglutaminase family protein [Thioclava sp. SK-1]OCX62800.1 transglutaminase [Thioclava sp. SK-1]